MARRLISTDYPDVVRHFGFQLYEHVVAQRWGHLTQSMRDALKYDLMRILAIGTRPLEQEQRFVMEKIAQVVVRMARSEWPDKWATLSGDLRALATTCGDVQRYMTLLIWRGLAEDIQAPDIPSAARTKVLRGLQGEQAETLRLLRDMLADVLSRPRDGGGRGGVRQLLLLALATCVEAVVGLAPLKVIAESGVMGAMPLLLSEEAEEDVVQLAAVDVCITLVGRKERLERASAEGGMLWALMGHVVQATAAQALKPSSQHLTLTKCLATATCDFGVTHLNALAAAVGGELMAVASLLSQLCRYPAMNVVAATLPFWGACIERQRNLPTPSAATPTSTAAPSTSSAPEASSEKGGVAGGEGRGLLEEGVQAQMYLAMVECLGRPCMTALDEEDFVDEEEYRQVNNVNPVFEFFLCSV